MYLLNSSRLNFWWHKIELQIKKHTGLSRGKFLKTYWLQTWLPSNRPKFKLYSIFSEVAIDQGESSSLSFVIKSFSPNTIVAGNCPSAGFNSVSLTLGSLSSNSLGGTYGLLTWYNLWPSLCSTTATKFLPTLIPCGCSLALFGSNTSRPRPFKADPASFSVMRLPWELKILQP